MDKKARQTAMDKKIPLAPLERN